MSVAAVASIERRLEGRALIEFERDAHAKAAYLREQDSRRLPLWDRVAHVVAIVLLATLGLLLLIVGPAAMMWFVHARAGTNSFLGMLAIAATLVTTGFSWSLLRYLHVSQELTVISHLPVPDGRYAHRAWRTVAGWFGISLYFALLAFGAIAWNDGLGPAGWCLALATGVLQWLVGLAIGTLCAVILPRFPYVTLMIVCVYAVAGYQHAGAPGWLTVTDVLNVAVPAGWVNALFSRGFLQGVPWVWWGIVPLALLVAAGVAAVRRLIRDYAIREFTIHAGSQVVAKSNLWPAPRDSLEWRMYRGMFRSVDNGLPEAASDAPLDAAAAMRRIRDRDFLRPATEIAPGLVRRWHRLFLTEREAALFDLMSGERMLWDRILLWGVLAFGIIVLSQCLPVVAPVAAMGSAIGAAFVMIGWIFLMAIGGPWFGFLSGDPSGMHVPRFAFVPVGFDEISRVMFKVACLRVLLCLPLLIAGFVHPAMMPGGNWLTWISMALFLVFLAVVAQWWFIGVHFAETTRFPNLSWSRLPWIVVRVCTSFWGANPMFVVILVLTIVLTEVLVPQLAQVLLPYILGVLALAFCGASYGSWLAVRAMYRRGIVDLVRTSASSGQQTLQSLERFDLQICRNREMRRRHGWLWPWRKRDRAPSEFDDRHGEPA